MKKLVLAAIFAVVFLMCSGTVYGAYYGVYDIRDDTDEPEKYPLVEDFQWVDHTYTYQGTGGEVFTVEFTLYAPTGWTTDPNGNSYGAYVDDDYSNSNVYSYYYKVTNTGSDLDSLTIPYSPADLGTTGVETGSTGSQPIVNNNTVDSTLNVYFDFPFIPGYDGLQAGESSMDFFMTSPNWWGWQSLSANGGLVTGTTTLSSLYDSPDGMIPAPNPEASTVALYIVGLIGMGTLYYRKKKMAEMEV